ncbi:MAG: mycofactocin precursor MftA [Thermomicrobium sp.]|nr:mycofactocin precursor MftA [Thermomicrobium sp.]
MEATVETLEQQAIVVEEREAAAIVEHADEVRAEEELVELLLKEITIDGMCGVY